jgi:hypothetical protein
MCGDQQEEKKEIVRSEPSPVPSKDNKLNWGNSFAFIAFLVGVFLMIINPPLALKILGLAFVCWGLFKFFRVSHWTHGWSRKRQNVWAFATIIVLCGISIPQFITQWRIEHPKPKLQPPVPVPKIAPAPTEAIKTSPLGVDLRPYINAARPAKANPQQQESAQARKPIDNRHRPATFKQLFENGWPNLTAYYSVSTLKLSTGTVHAEIKLPWRLNGDFGARSRFLEFFLDDNVWPEEAFAACVCISKNYQQFIGAADSSIDIAGQLPEDSSVTHFKDMIFSGRIFIYYRNPELSLQQKSALESLYKQSGLSLQFRGEDYALLYRTDHPQLRAKPLVPNNVLLPDPGDSRPMFTFRNLNPKN